MNPALLIPLIQGAAKLVQELTPVVQSVVTHLNSDDQDALQQALADMRQAVDAQHNVTQSLLRG